MFPGVPFPNADTLAATVTAPLAVGTVVAYSCTGANRELNGIQSNMCDMNGMYTMPAPTCDLGKLISIMIFDDWCQACRLHGS